MRVQVVKSFSTVLLIVYNLYQNRCAYDSSSTFSSTLIISNKYGFRLKSNQFHSKITCAHFHIYLK